MNGREADGSRWLTVTEAAKELHVHVNTVRNWSKNGVLPVYRLGKRKDRRFRRTDVRKLLQRQIEANTGCLGLRQAMLASLAAILGALILNILV